ncbi:MAG: PAS domain S-box protein [Salinivirgaceae bacterium]|nr:PAS domain S-box protein [Salinivirgaceae bacterium]
MSIDTSTALDLFFKNSNDLVLVLDSDCKIVRINPTCVKIFGYQPEELVGRHIMELVHSDDTERAEIQIKNIFNNEGVNFPFKNKALHKDGSTRWLSWSSCVIDGVLYATGTDVTMQEEKMRNLKNLRKQYMSGVNSMLGLWEIDIESREFYGDERTYEIFGLPYKIKQKLTDLVFILTDEYQAIAIEQIRKSLKSKMFRNFECDIICQTDKQIHTIAVSGSLVFDADFNIKSFFGTIQDITEQKAISMKLAEMAQLQRTLLATLEPLVALYSNNHIKWANKQEMLGYTAEYLADKPISVIFKNPDDYSKIKADAYKNMGQGATYTTEFEAVSLAGNTAWIHLSGKLMSQDSVIWTAIDITEQKENEIKLKKALAKAEESDKLKETLLQKLSHEIRTPLNAIVGFSDVLSTAGNLPQATVKSYTDIISENSTQLLRIITDMLTMSDLDASRVSVSIESVNIDMELERLFSRYRAKAESKKINLIYCQPQTAGLSIATDRAKFVRIMSNLIDNAIKFTEQGNVSFGYNLINNDIEFFVEDEGEGIPVAAQKHLFDRFYQITEMGSSSGIGIGLTISKAFATMIGGSMRFKSEEGVGTTFYLTLPVCVK